MRWTELAAKAELGLAMMPQDLSLDRPPFS